MEESIVPIATADSGESHVSEAAENIEADVTATDQGAESSETKPDTQSQGYSSTFEIEGKQYSISEEQVRKYYGIDPADVITPKEWKTIVSSYKQGIQYNNKNRIASQAIKQAESALEVIKNKPKESLRALFQDNPQVLRQVAEEMLLEELELEMLDPKDRRVRELEAELQKRELEKQNIQKAEDEKQAQMYAEQYRGQLENEIMEVIDKTNMPKSPLTVRQIATRMLEFMASGKDVSPYQVAELVSRDMASAIRESLKNATPEQLIKLLGEDKLKELRNGDIQRLKSQAVSNRSKPSEPGDMPKKKTETKWMTTDQLRDMARERIKNLR